MIGRAFPYAPGFKGKASGGMIYPFSGTNVVFARLLRACREGSEEISAPRGREANNRAVAGEPLYRDLFEDRER